MPGENPIEAWECRSKSLGGKVFAFSSHLEYSVTLPSTTAATYCCEARSRTCTTWCPSRASFPHRLGFSRFCSIAWYSVPPIRNRTVRNRCPPVRETREVLPPTVTCVPFIICWATELNVVWSSMTFHPEARAVCAGGSLWRQLRS